MFIVYLYIFIKQHVYLYTVAYFYEATKHLWFLDSIHSSIQNFVHLFVLFYVICLDCPFTSQNWKWSIWVKVCFQHGPQVIFFFSLLLLKGSFTLPLRLLFQKNTSIFYCNMCLYFVPQHIMHKRVLCGNSSYQTLFLEESNTPLPLVLN